MPGKRDDRDWKFMAIALETALASMSDPEKIGIPVGALLVNDSDDAILARGHNERVQENNPILHGEMACLRNFGRTPSYKGMTLYTTLSPCMMCAGTIVQFKIPRVVIGQKEILIPADRPFKGNIEFLKSNGVEVLLLNDPACESMFNDFVNEHLDLWLEDIGEDK